MNKYIDKLMNIYIQAPNGWYESNGTPLATGGERTTAKKNKEQNAGHSTTVYNYKPLSVGLASNQALEVSRHMK